MVELPPHGFITNFHNRIRSTVSNEFSDTNSVGIYMNNVTGSNNEEFGNASSLAIGGRRTTTRKRINYSEDNFSKYNESESNNDEDEEDIDNADTSEFGRGVDGKNKKQKKKAVDNDLLKEQYYKHVKDIIDPYGESDDEEGADPNGIPDENGNFIKYVDFPSFDDPVNSTNYLKFRQLKETVTQGRLTRAYNETLNFTGLNPPSVDKDTELDYSSARNVPISIQFDDPLKPGNTFKDDLIWNINDRSLSVETFLEIYMLDLNINSESLFNKVLVSIKEQISKYSTVARLPVLNDLVIMLKLDSFLGRQNLRDLFYLNLKDSLFNLEEIVEVIASDLGLKREWLAILSHRILSYVLDVKQKILDNNLEEGVLLHLDDLSMALRLDVENLGVEYQPLVMNLTKTEMEKRLEENGKRRINHRRINRRNL
ncbi:hypothetical protein QEN19_001140 [Hanseniaspora menglaensis]